MVNMKDLVNKQSKLIAKKSTSRAKRIELTDQNMRGEITLHMIPDPNETLMLTARNVMLVTQSEKYTYQGEEKTKRYTQIIPKSSSYIDIDGAVIPTEMQIKKLDKLWDLLDYYNELTNKFQPGGAKIDFKETKTRMFVKRAGYYTRFWAKIAEIKPTTPSDALSYIDTSKVALISHSSSNFISAFNKWATPDIDSEVSVEEQSKKIDDAVSGEVGDGLRCMKIKTVKSANIGYDVEVKNIKPDTNSVVNISDEDLSDISPLNTNDWDFTAFDDAKVDELISRVESYINEYAPSEDDESADEENEEKATSPIEEETSEDNGNPFSDD